MSFTHRFGDHKNGARKIHVWILKHSLFIPKQVTIRNTISSRFWVAETVPRFVFILSSGSELWCHPVRYEGGCKRSPHLMVCRDMQSLFQKEEGKLLCVCIPCPARLRCLSRCAYDKENIRILWGRKSNEKWNRKMLKSDTFGIFLIYFEFVYASMSARVTLMAYVYTYTCVHECVASSLVHSYMTVQIPHSLFLVLPGVEAFLRLEFQKGKKTECNQASGSILSNLNNL